MPVAKTVAQILAAEGIADYPQDLRQLSAAELRRLFAFTSSGKINAIRYCLKVQAAAVDERLLCVVPSQQQ